MKHDEAAVPRYAHALFNAADKTGHLKKVKEDLTELCKSLKPSGLLGFLQNPRYISERKKRVLEQIGKQFRSSLMVPFLHLLLRKARINLLYGIERHYASLFAEQCGIVPVHVVLAGKPNASFKERLNKSLAKMTKKKVDVRYTMDPEIIGGIQIRFKDRMLDGSVRSRLDMIRERLLETEIN